MKRLLLTTSLSMLMGLILFTATGQAQSVIQSPDSSQTAATDSTAPRKVPVSTALILESEQLQDTDHQEFSDYVRLMPGYYPLDRAGFASASRGLMLGLSPKTLVLNFRGRQIEDHRWVRRIWVGPRLKRLHGWI